MDAVTAAWWRDPLVSTSVAVTIALVFAQSLVHKVADRQRFSASVAAYRLLPDRLVAPAATLLILVEAMVVLGIVAGSPRAAALGLAALLLAGYGAAIALNLLKGRRDLDCGCGGDAQPIAWPLVVRNGVLCACALAAAQPPVARPLEAFDLFAVAAASLGLWGLTHVADELIRQGGRVAALRRPHDAH